MSRALARAFRVAALFAGPPASVAAQGSSAVHQADSLAARGDSAAAVAVLDAALRRDEGDAAAWHRRGMLAWAKARPRREAGLIKHREDITLLRLADSALGTAVALAPDSARYGVDLGRFLLNSKVSVTRFAAQGVLRRALETARRVGDAHARAAAADEVGMVHWRRYETAADRRNPTALAADALGDLPRTTADTAGLRNVIANFYANAAEWPGEADYVAATDRFIEALKADPTYAPAQRHAFMALAEQRRWEELRNVAQLRLAAAPRDPHAWLARGLASHRLNDERDAGAAFDSALVLLTPEDRERYTRLSRLLRPKGNDGTAFANAQRFERVPAAQRAELERTYWMLSDPLALTPENEHWLEFLARVAYAELLWTSDDLDVKGADTDRGDIHVRYGPPAITHRFGAEQGSWSGIVLWLYEDGLYFVFGGAPTFGTMQLEMDADPIRRQAPVRWRNVPVDRSIDSARVQVARFRAGGDSADVLFVADLPVDRLTAGLDVSRVPLDVDLRVYTGAAQLLVHDSARTTLAVAALDAGRVRAWRERLPAGTHVYRVEAYQADAGRAARALATVAAEPAAGFGVSDVVVAERVLPKEGSDGARWADFNIAPNAGRFRRGQAVGLLWETYELAAADGASRYRVAVTLEKVRRSGPAAFAAQVVAGVAGAVGRSARGNGRVTLTFDRQLPTRPVVVDYLTLDLGSAPAGRYRLGVEVTDLVSGKRTTRESAITILE